MLFSAACLKLPPLRVSPVLLNTPATLADNINLSLILTALIHQSKSPTILNCSSNGPTLSYRDLLKMKNGPQCIDRANSRLLKTGGMIFFHFIKNGRPKNFKYHLMINGK